MALFSYVWFDDVRLAATVLVAMIANGLVAVLTGILIPIVFSKLQKDPGAGNHELTAISDSVSLLICLVVASAILLR